MRIRTGSRKIALGQPFDRLRHGGRKHQRLPMRRQFGNNVLHVGHEAHVQHAVGFVEDENFDVAQVDIALVHQVDQPARRGDENIDAVLERPRLRILAHAAVNDRLPQRGVLAVGAETFADLAGQLAGRREDERADAASVAFRRIARRASSDAAAGSANAAVLPVPVCAQPSRSRPAITCGMACDWMGVGVV